MKRNTNGDVILEEYFTKAGRLIRTEETDYREDGTETCVGSPEYYDEYGYRIR